MPVQCGFPSSRISRPCRRALRSGISSLALLAGLVLANGPAHAACGPITDGDDTITCDQPGQLLPFAGNDTVTVNAGFNGAIVGDYRYPKPLPEIGYGNDHITVNSGAIVTQYINGDAFVWTPGIGPLGNDTIIFNEGAQFTPSQVSIFNGITGDLNYLRDISNIYPGPSLTIALGNDTILLNGGTINGDVVGDVWSADPSYAPFVTGGNDTIVLDGANIVYSYAGYSNSRGEIRGDYGDDLIALRKGSAVGVRGGTGNDTITLGGSGLAGADIGKFIEGNDGDDLITLTSGTVGGPVSGDAGNDTLVLNGATIGGLMGGDGDDTATWSSGLLTEFDGGNGSDLLTVTAATWDGSQTLSGGDDVLADDGYIDTLTLSGLTVTANGSSLPDWERLVLADATTLTLAGPGAEVGSGPATGGPLGMIVQGGTTLRFAESAFTLTGDLANAGTVVLGNGNAGDTLTVTAGYAGNGGTVTLDTVLGNDASATDILVVGGATSGTTTLVVNNIGGTGAATTTGILIVQTTDFTGSFVLQGGSVSAGDFTYTLAQGSEGWYLVAKAAVVEPPAPGSIHEALPAALLARLPTLEQRVGQRQWLGRDSSRVGVVDPARGAWMRVWGDKSEIRPESSTSGIAADRRDWGLQLGYDQPLERGDAGQWVLGITLQAGHSSTDVTTAKGTGSIKADGLGLGVTGTWYGDNGLYVDLQGQVNRLKTDVTFDGATLLDGKSLTATAVGAEIGWRKAISANSALVPQAQLTWSHISGGSFTDDQGTLVDLGHNDQLIGRIGVAWEYEYSEGWLFGDRATSSEVNHREKVYVIGNLLHNFSGDTTVTVDGVALTQTNAATWAEIGVGGSYLWDGNKTVYTEMSYRRAIGGGDAEGLAATVGFRVQF